MTIFARSEIRGSAERTVERSGLSRFKLLDLPRRADRTISLQAAAHIEAAKSGSIGLATSQISLLECLVEPVRRSDRELEEKFRSILLGSREMQTIPVLTNVLERAIGVRARHGLKTPDAIHAATALEFETAAFYKNDPGFLRVKDLPVQLLADAS